MNIINSEEYKHKLPNGPAMVVQGARCNACGDWQEFEVTMPVLAIGPYECVIGPWCNKCERNYESLWVLYFAPASEMAGV